MPSYLQKKDRRAFAGLTVQHSHVCLLLVDRGAFCVKETMKMENSADCGRTKYFGDRYNPLTKLCELRKCAANCTEGTWSYEFEGEPLARKRCGCISLSQLLSFL
jgi:hypothetical protein